MKSGDIYCVKIKSKIPLKDGIYNFSISIEHPLELNIKHEFMDVIEGCLTFKINWGEIRFPTMFYVDDVNIQLGKINKA